MSLYAMYFDELVYCTETGFVTHEVIPAVKAYRPAGRERMKVAG